MDRTNNDGNYEPSNVKWATAVEQGSNKRNNRKVEYYGELYTLAELSRLTKISRKTLRKHLNNELCIYDIVKKVNAYKVIK